MRDIATAAIPGKLPQITPARHDFCAIAGFQIAQDAAKVLLGCRQGNGEIGGSIRLAAIRYELPGGQEEAYERVRPVFEAVAAKVKGEPCVAYPGPGSAGHYVKMVHTGIRP